MENESIALLQQASNEIKSLRNTNSIIAARLDTFDKCVLLLTANIPSANMGMTEDIAWKIDRFVDSVNEKQAPTNVINQF